MLRCCCLNNILLRTSWLCDEFGFPLQFEFLSFLGEIMILQLRGWSFSTAARTVRLCMVAM
jgi:hypothetical protein